MLSYSTETSRYVKNTTVAAAEACAEFHLPTELGRLIGLALDGWWNDTNDWADNPALWTLENILKERR